MAVSDGRIMALGSWSDVRSGHTEAEVLDARDAFLLPGLGIDVGAGTGFSMFNEGLMAYQWQMLSPDHVALGPAHLLGALFTLTRKESIAEVRVAGRVVFSGAGA
jgi:cytosine/adenosine deaminase-related metal-dependent hydrolase